MGFRSSGRKWEHSFIHQLHRNLQWRHATNHHGLLLRLLICQSLGCVTPTFRCTRDDTSGKPAIGTPRTVLDSDTNFLSAFLPRSYSRLKCQISPFPSRDLFPYIFPSIYSGTSTSFSIFMMVPSFHTVSLLRVPLLKYMRGIIHQSCGESQQRNLRRKATLSNLQTSYYMDPENQFNNSTSNLLSIYTETFISSSQSSMLVSKVVAFLSKWYQSSWQPLLHSTVVVFFPGPTKSFLILKITILQFEMQTFSNCHCTTRVHSIIERAESQ